MGSANSKKMAGNKGGDFQEKLEKRIEDMDFPCVGAKAAHAHGAIEFFTARDIESPAEDLNLATRIQDFASAQAEDAVFTSLAIGFPHSRRLSEQAFEAALWDRLRGIHEFDSALYPWDSNVSDDPASPHFSMSIGGKAFYIIGMHADASRVARRFAYPLLIFNLHSQFERLRQDGRYASMKETIIARDIALCGSANPMLAVHGEISEARQYSGRQVTAGWKCPFSARREAPDAR